MGLLSKLLGRPEAKKRRGLRHVACEVCGRTATYRVRDSPQGDLDGKLVCKACAYPGVIVEPV